jgi:hypothetical protein
VNPKTTEATFHINCFKEFQKIHKHIAFTMPCQKMQKAILVAFIGTNVLHKINWEFGQRPLKLFVNMQLNINFAGV